MELNWREFSKSHKGLQFYTYNCYIFLCSSDFIVLIFSVGCNAHFLTKKQKQKKHTKKHRNCKQALRLCDKFAMHPLPGHYGLSQYFCGGEWSEF